MVSSCVRVGEPKFTTVVPYRVFLCLAQSVEIASPPAEIFEEISTDDVNQFCSRPHVRARPVTGANRESIFAENIIFENTIFYPIEFFSIRKGPKGVSSVIF